MNLGSILKQLRGKKSLSQENIARAVGCTRQNVSYMEKGDSNITVKSLLSILTELNCSLKIVDNEDMERFEIKSKESSERSMASD